MDFHPDGNISSPGLIFRLREYFANNNGAYKRVPAIQDFSYDALTTGPCVGSGIIKTSAGTAKWFAGSTTKVYQADGAGAWTDRSGGVTFSATTWDFCAFGDNTIAANGASKLQVATSGNFADISQAPTGPKIVFPHANALIALGNSTDGAAWARCATGDHTTWTSTASNDADANTLYGGVGGPITAGGAWENLAIAWKSRAMYAGVYVGNADPTLPVLRWQMISSDVGCVSQWGWIGTEAGIIFVSERDILLFNGNKPVPIADKIRKRFVREGNANRAKTFLTLDEGNNQVYIWRASADGTWCDHAWIYNYKTGQWGYLDTLSDATELIIGDPKIPVRNANYRDMVALGGGATNSEEVANLFIDDTGEYPLNLASSTYAGGNSFIETGIFGKPDRDTMLLRVHLIFDSYANSGTGYSLAVVKFGFNKTNTSTKTVSTMKDGAYFDVQETSRFFYLQVTGGDTATGGGIQAIVCEMQDLGSNKTWFETY